MSDESVIPAQQVPAEPDLFASGLLSTLSAMLETLSGPAILLDLNYRIRAANNAYRDAFQSDQPLLGATCYHISHGYDRPCDQAGEECPLAACQQSGQRQRILHIHNTRHGREHVDVEVTPVRDDEGRICGFVEVMKPLLRSEVSRNMLGFSPMFNRMLDLLNRAAGSSVSVLLQGESGTGKELAARYLHEHSHRAGKPFVVVECSGLPDTLFESELFGHEKGAFTGATAAKRGLVAEADGGTLFLDELGDVPLSMQVKLLRLIESGTYRPVGSTRVAHADFRLVCATHQPLALMAQDGRFREDLYFRVSAFPIHLPALRERKEDIPGLAAFFLKQVNPAGQLRLSESALDWLCQQPFRGNIRELRNRIERASLLCDSGDIGIADLGGETIEQAEKPMPEKPESLRDLLLEHLIDPAETPPEVGELERRYLRYLQERFPQGRKHLARLLNISERTLYRKLKDLDHSP